MQSHIENLIKAATAIVAQAQNGELFCQDDSCTAKNSFLLDELEMAIDNARGEEDRAAFIALITTSDAGQQSSRLDHLDSIAAEARNYVEDRIGVLSTGERLYVALAANRPDLIADYTIAQALARLGEDDTAALIERWRYA